VAKKVTIEMGCEEGEKDIVAESGANRVAESGVRNAPESGTKGLWDPSRCAVS
jgi:hypothetical protein